MTGGDGQEDLVLAGTPWPLRRLPLKRDDRLRALERRLAEQGPAGDSEDVRRELLELQERVAGSVLIVSFVAGGLAVAVLRRRSRGERA